jgi:hypothetical protein
MATREIDESHALRLRLRSQTLPSATLHASLIIVAKTGPSGTSLDSVRGADSGRSEAPLTDSFPGHVVAVDLVVVVVHARARLGGRASLRCMEVRKSVGLMRRPHGRGCPWLVLSVVWVLVVVGVGVPAAWLVRGTLAASEGAKTPAVPVLDVVGGLSQWIGEVDMMHVAHLLCSKHSGQMLEQLRSIRLSLKAKGA